MLGRWWVAKASAARPAAMSGVMKIIPEAISEVRLGGVTFRLPFAHLFPPLSPAQHADLVASIKARGVWERVNVYRSAVYGIHAVIDGANRLRIAADLGLSTVPWVTRGDMTDETALEIAITLNQDRRHLTPAELVECRAKRNGQIVEAREEGESFRSIAARFHLDPKTVWRVIEAAGVADATRGTVTGADGKQYPATKPKKERQPLSPLDASVRYYGRAYEALVDLMGTPDGARLQQILSSRHVDADITLVLLTLRECLNDLASQSAQPPV